MKHLIHASIALGLLCVGGVSTAQDQAQTTTMRDITVNAVPSYETYVADLPTGYALHALVGNTHRQYLQAQRDAEQSDALRRSGLAVPAHVSVAIDNFSGPGTARQIWLIDGSRETVAIVNVYCKRVMPSGGPRCQLAPLPMSGSSNGESQASIDSAYLQVAQVALPD